LFADRANSSRGYCFVPIVQQEMKNPNPTIVITKIALLILMGAMSLAIMGCRSEVDKCVDAWVKSYSKTSPDVEAVARIECLKAQAGKE
jgi:hypothetical protein